MKLILEQKFHPVLKVFKTLFCFLFTCVFTLCFDSQIHFFFTCQKFKHICGFFIDVIFLP